MIGAESMGHEMRKHIARVAGKFALRNVNIENGRRGFALIETLCSLALLGISLAALLMSLDYAFRSTLETRIRAEDYAREEAAALAAVVAENVSGDASPEASGVAAPKIIPLQSRTSAGKDLAFNALVWRMPVSADRLRSGPVFVTILNKTD